MFTVACSMLRTFGPSQPPPDGRSIGGCIAPTTPSRRSDSSTYRSLQPLAMAVSMTRPVGAKRTWMSQTRLRSPASIRRRCSWSVDRASEIELLDHPVSASGRSRSAQTSVRIASKFAAVSTRRAQVRLAGITRSRLRHTCFPNRGLGVPAVRRLLGLELVLPVYVASPIECWHDDVG